MGKEAADVDGGDQCRLKREDEELREEIFRWVFHFVYV